MRDVPASAEDGTVRVAAVQAASDFLSRQGSTRRACELIREAGANGAEFIAFPEGFIPAHPGWFHLHPDTHPVSTELSLALFKNAVELPGAETAALGAAARDAGAYVVIGVCERVRGTDGTLFNTQVYLGPDGAVIGKHRKLMPTLGERLVHASGHGDTFGTFPTRFGRASALICGENQNPLAVFALAAEYTRVHGMSWPPHFNQGVRDMADLVELTSRAFATMAKSFVVSACGVIDETMIAQLQASDADEAFLRIPEVCGGSLIVAPNGAVLAGPLPGGQQGIVFADLDLEAPVRAKLHQDFAGHYNRADVFQLRVSRYAPQLYGEANPMDGAPPTGENADG